MMFIRVVTSVKWDTSRSQAVLSANMANGYVNIISWNINGCGNRVKRKKIFTYFKSKQANIVFIQESHLTDTEALKFRGCRSVS